MRVRARPVTGQALCGWLLGLANAQTNAINLAVQKSDGPCNLGRFTNSAITAKQETVAKGPRTIYNSSVSTCIGSVPRITKRNIITETTKGTEALTIFLSAQRSPL